MGADNPPLGRCVSRARLRSRRRREDGGIPPYRTVLIEQSRATERSRGSVDGSIANHATGALARLHLSLRYGTTVLGAHDTDVQLEHHQRERSGSKAPTCTLPHNRCMRLAQLFTLAACVKTLGGGAVITGINSLRDQNSHQNEHRDCSLPLLVPSSSPQLREVVATEVVATTFSRVDGQVWINWNWSSITTVIDVYRFGNESALACIAHQHGARLLLNMGDKELVHWGFNRTRDLANKSAYERVAAQVQLAGADGISLDIESNVAAHPDQQDGCRANLTLFTQRLRDALRRVNPAAILVFCTTGYPDRPDSNKGAWPHFDLAALSLATDWFFVMGYGTDEWRDGHAAISNSNIELTRNLIEGYPRIGVPVSHLVLGLPWYGYDNTCANSTQRDARLCVRSKSGKELGSDAFFQELPLMYDLRHLDACDPPRRKCGPESFAPKRHTVLGLLANRSSPLMYDEDSQSPFFNYVDTEDGSTHQVWFESPDSLHMKFELARNAGLRGVGSWRSDDVDYGGVVAARCSHMLWSTMVGNGDGGAQSARTSCPLNAITRSRSPSSLVAPTNAYMYAQHDSGNSVRRPTVSVLSQHFKIVYSYNADPCPHKDKTLSDSPARAFRNTSGTVHLYSSDNQGSRASVGSYLNGTLVRDCNVFYNGSVSGSKPNPALFEGSEWVQGSAVSDDGSIYALVHNEWHPNPGTAAGAYANCSKPDCWVSWITMVVSHNGGKSFEHALPPPHHLVASLPEKYQDGWAGPGNGRSPYGFQNPSNIMRNPKDGHYYALISTWGTMSLPGVQTRQPRGNCLIRTHDLNAGPLAWRAWGGRRFDVVLNEDPYTADGAKNPADHICAPVTTTNEYLTLVWSTYYQQFMTIFGDGDCSTVSFKLSHDLITWSDSVTIRKAICSGGVWEIYPSLIDPASPSASFDTVGKTASLFFVNLHGRQIWSYDIEFGGMD